MSPKSPLVFLFGWLKANTRHLAKYESLYKDYGADVTTISSTISNTALPSIANIHAADFVQHILDKASKRQESPIFIQCMSNGGFIGLSNALRLSVSSPTSPPSSSRIFQSFQKLLDTRLKGIVFDSAPSLALPQIWAKGFLAASLGISTTTVEEVHPVAVRAAHEFAERFYFSNPSIVRWHRELRQMWSQTFPPVPQLYLYSIGDPLIPSTHIEHFIAQQAHRGVMVQRQCWQNSGHCEHLHYHHDHYKQLAYSFMDDCLCDTTKLEAKNVI